VAPNIYTTSHHYVYDLYVHFYKQSLVEMAKYYYSLPHTRKSEYPQIES
jgi:hypothetical protein